MTGSPCPPIDTRQHMWWHRLRRLGPWGFSLLGGAVLSPLLTCLLFAGVILYFRYPWSVYAGTGALIWAVSAPVYTAACMWTWSHMEKRYAATLATHCPQCGYSRRGGGLSSRCPECGEPVTPARAPRAAGPR